MKESKLTEILKGISRNEYRKFGEFLNSPFHNKSRNIQQLYELISKNFQNLDSYVISIRYIIPNVFKGKKNGDQNARTLLSLFTKLLEQFLVYTEFEKYSRGQKVTLLKALSDRNISKAFETTVKEVNLNLSEEFNRNIDYYYDVLTAKEIYLNYEGENVELDLDKEYIKMAEEADCMFIVTKLKILNTVLSRRYRPLADLQSQYWGIDRLVKYIERNISNIKKNHPTVYSEYKILMMVLNPENPQHFLDLKQHVFSNVSNYKSDEKLQVYYSLTNHCVNRLARGDSKFLKSLFEIYKQFENTGFYKDSNNLQYIDFMNVIQCGVDIKNIKWIESFLENYQSNLSNDIKKDTINLGKAIIFFAKKEYEKCIEHLSKVSYRKVFFYLKVKETQIKVYYEQGETESSESALDALSHYLKRHKDKMGIHYSRYSTFIKYLKRMLKLDPKDNIGIRLFVKELMVAKDLIAREWILERLIQLE